MSTSPNGIDLLFVIIAFALLWVIWECSTRYNNWSKWNQNRCKLRAIERNYQNDILAEKEYRLQLRRISRILWLTDSMTQMTVVTNKVKNTFIELNRTYDGLDISQENRPL